MVTEYLLNPRSTGLGRSYQPRVLVIDNSFSDSLLAQANFLAAGINADTAAGEKEALNYLHRNRYDAVVCNTKLAGGVHGPDLVDRLREVHQGPIIGTSTEDSPDTAHSWEVKAVRYIPKPFGRYSGYVAEIKELIR